MIRTLFTGIRNLIKWSKLIWCDHQWDDCYIFEMLRFKLVVMEKFYSSDNAMSANAKKVARKIHICILLIDRILLNDYPTPFDERNEPSFRRFQEAFERSLHSETDENGLIHLTRDYDDTPLERQIFKWKTEHEDNLLKQDINYLFNFMAKHIRGWWD